MQEILTARNRSTDDLSRRSSRETSAKLDSQVENFPSKWLVKQIACRYRLSVTIVKRLIALSMFVVLGLALTANSFEAAEHLLVQQGQVSSQPSNNHFEAASDCGSAGHSHATAEHCADPCHAGKTHFGHSSFLSSRTTVFLGAGTQVSTPIPASFAGTEGPALEGPRKPPRLS